jgi:hypothetical protein
MPIGLLNEAAEATASMLPKLPVPAKYTFVPLVTAVKRITLSYIETQLKRVPRIL